MIYLSQLLGNPVLDAGGEKLGAVSDLGIATGEIFPRITSLAFVGPGKTPFMISWRKYVESFSEDEVRLKIPAEDVRFSYLQPDEVLLARDILDKQIVDTGGMRVVRVNDLKLSDADASQLRLLGAEVGARGILRSLSPVAEKFAVNAAKLFGRELPERIIAWSYMDLVERNLSDVKLAVSHKTLDDMHPADVADIIEKLDPRLRTRVFAQLDQEQQAEAVAELDDDELAAELVGDMEEREASQVLSAMDPDDAAELVSELDYEKAETLLRLMGVNERRAVSQLLGYREGTAGRIMTSEVVAVPNSGTVADAISALRALDEDFESARYVYLVDGSKRLTGAVSLNSLIVSKSKQPLAELSSDELITASPDDDQELVAENISKYNLLALPVVDDAGKLLGVVTVDDALDVLEEEHAEDLQIAGSHVGYTTTGVSLLSRMFSREAWFFVWVLAASVLALIAASRGVDVAAALVACVAMPLALRGADTMIRHTSDFFIENDGNGEEDVSLFGFGLRTTAISLVFALLVVLLIRVIEGFLFDPLLASSPDAVLAWQYTSIAATGFLVATVCVVLAFAVSPLVLAFLRKRSAAEQETNGLALRIGALLVSALVFCIIIAFFVLGLFGM